MSTRALLLVFICACTMAATHCVAQEAGFPERPVRVIVPTSPGGILDTVIRLLAPKLAAHIRKETVRWAKVIKASGIRSE